MIDRRLLSWIKPAALSVLVGLTAPATAAAQGMPLDQVRYIEDPSKPRQDPMYRGAAIDQMGEADRALAHSSSRIEAEGKADIPRAQLEQAIGGLRKLTRDPVLTERVLGKGWRVVEVGQWNVKDTYRDNDAYDLAQRDSGFRVRTQGGRSEINTKPPGGVRTGRDGLITIRVEQGLSTGSATSLERVASTRSTHNPLGWIRRELKQDPGSFVRPAVQVDQLRTRFVLQKAEGTDAGGQPHWNPLVDISVDDVTATDARAAGGGEKIAFAQIEFDLNHPGSNTGLVVANVNWKGPHRSRDILRPELMQDEAIQDLVRQVPALLDHLGVDATAGHSKYATAALALKLIKTPPAIRMLPQAGPAASRTSPASSRAALASRGQGATRQGAPRATGHASDARASRAPRIPRSR